MLDKIFSVGNRKVIALVLALAAILFGDKLGITMTEEMNDSIVQLVAVFTGGNVLSKFAFALLNKTGAKLPKIQLEEEPVKGLESLAVSSSADEIAEVADYARRIAQDTTNTFNNVFTQLKSIEEHLTKQNNSINGLIGIINSKPQAKQQVPTPNDLYQG